MTSSQSIKGVVSLQEGKRFIVDCLKAVDTPTDHAEQLAELLIAADYRGHYSHGLNRLGMELFMNVYWRSYELFFVCRNVLQGCIFWHL